MKRLLTAHSAFKIVAMLVLLLSQENSAFADDSPLLPDHEATARMRDWQKLRYGMFMCFGMTTFTGVEVDDGKSPSATYAPTALDVDQWVRVAKDAGMKYAVLTAKHVSGHCLWDSKVTWHGKEFDYDVASSGNTTDVIAAFTKACGKYGVMPGLYYCMLDSHNNPLPTQQQWNAGKLPEEYFQLVIDQLTELAKNYPDVRYYWLDIPRAASAQQRARLYDLVRRVNPTSVVLFNLGLDGSKSGMTVESTSAISWPTDVITSERLPMSVPFVPAQTWKGQPYFLGYEHCDCAGKDWFWTADDKMRPTADLFKIYDQVANRAGGNFLLSIGPDRRGVIDQPRIDALMALKAMIDNPPPPSLAIGKPAKASSEWGAGFEAGKAFDDDESTRWGAAPHTTSGWLEVDLGKATLVGRAVIKELAWPRTQQFAIEYKDGETWKSLVTGQTIGGTKSFEFEPVNAQVFRLNILKASDVPTIEEFQLFAPAARASGLNVRNRYP